MPILDVLVELPIIGIVDEEDYGGAFPF